MKNICTCCGKEKVIEEFVKSNRVKTGYCNRCKSCQRDMSKTQYRKNPELAKSLTTKCRKDKSIKLQEYKKGLVCKGCGMNEYYCLDFHHKDPKTKLFEVCQAGLRNYDWSRILEEISKCDVLCANCHRRHHWKEKINLLEGALK